MKIVAFRHKKEGKTLQTTIGHSLQGSPRLATAGLIGAFAIAADFALFCWRDAVSDEARGTVALLGLVAYVYLVQGDSASLGLRIRPIQGWWYWFKAAIFIGLAIAGLLAAAAVTFLLWRPDVPTPKMHTVSPQFVGSAFLQMCIVAPVLEETLYRLLVCVPLAGWNRPRLAIITSGLLFAALHFAYGNPSPENIFGGLFLAWAYLKSGTIVMPVLLHALGNFLVLAMQVVAWYC